MLFGAGTCRYSYRYHALFCVPKQCQKVAKASFYMVLDIKQRKRNVPLWACPDLVTLAASFYMVLDIKIYIQDVFATLCPPTLDRILSIEYPITVPLV